MEGEGGRSCFNTCAHAVNSCMGDSQGEDESSLPILVCHSRFNGISGNTHINSPPAHSAVFMLANDSHYLCKSVFLLTGGLVWER